MADSKVRAIKPARYDLPMSINYANLHDVVNRIQFATIADRLAELSLYVGSQRSSDRHPHGHFRIRLKGQLPPVIPERRRL